MNDAAFVRMEKRLENWGRWAFDDRNRRGRCLSVEHRYLPPKLADDDQAIHRTRMPLDVLDAEIVERAVVALHCTDARRFLVVCYVRRLSLPTICRMFRLRWDMYQGYRRRVVDMVGESVRELEPQLVRRGRSIWAGTTRIAVTCKM